MGRLIEPWDFESAQRTARQARLDYEAARSEGNSMRIATCERIYRDMQARLAEFCPHKWSVNLNFGGAVCVLCDTHQPSSGVATIPSFAHVNQTPQHAPPLHLPAVTTAYYMDDTVVFHHSSTN